jgi:hypothetical protein
MVSFSIQVMKVLIMEGELVLRFHLKMYIMSRFNICTALQCNTCEQSVQHQQFHRRHTVGKLRFVYYAPKMYHQLQLVHVRKSNVGSVKTGIV